MVAWMENLNMGGFAYEGMSIRIMKCVFTLLALDDAAGRLNLFASKNWARTPITINQTFTHHFARFSKE